MNELAKILESKTKIRFQDCDPFNHLNNGKYIEYLINAREDQLIAYYNLDIFEYAKQTGNSWVVGSNQIGYLRPANLMEVVSIDSQLIRYSDKNLFVEIRMWNEAKTELKAILWSSFVHFNILKAKAAHHSNELKDLFQKVCLPIEEKTFEERLNSFRLQKVS